MTWAYVLVQPFLVWTSFTTLARFMIIYMSLLLVVLFLWQRQPLVGLGVFICRVSESWHFHVLCYSSFRGFFFFGFRSEKLRKPQRRLRVNFRILNGSFCNAVVRWCLLKCSRWLCWALEYGLNEYGSNFTFVELNLFMLLFPWPEKNEKSRQQLCVSFQFVASGNSLIYLISLCVLGLPSRTSSLRCTKSFN